METVAHYRDIIVCVLAEETGPSSVDSVNDVLIRDDKAGRFLVITTGWYWFKDRYEVVVDVALSDDGQVIIYKDVADESVADRMIKAGIPVMAIIKAYDLDEMERLGLLKREEQTQPPKQRTAA